MEKKLMDVDCGSPCLESSLARFVFDGGGDMTERLLTELASLKIAQMLIVSQIRAISFLLGDLKNDQIDV